MKELDEYLQEIAKYSDEDHDLFQEVGIKIAKNLQRRQELEQARLRQSMMILKLVYCHNHARNPF